MGEEAAGEEELNGVAGFVIQSNKHPESDGFRMCLTAIDAGQWQICERLDTELQLEKRERTMQRYQGMQGILMKGYIKIGLLQMTCFNTGATDLMLQHIRDTLSTNRPQNATIGQGSSPFQKVKLATINASQGGAHFHHSTNQVPTAAATIPR